MTQTTYGEKTPARMSARMSLRNTHLVYQRPIEPDSMAQTRAISELDKWTWLRLHELLDSMLIKASNDLFEEFRNVDDGVSRNIRSLTALMVWREFLIKGFRKSISESWQRLGQPVIQQPLQLEDRVVAWMAEYARISEASHPDLLMELDDVIHTIFGGKRGIHALNHGHLLRVFWGSTECTCATVNERLQMLALFNEFILEEIALVWESALNLLNTARH